MRQLVIDRIRTSSCYKRALDNGMEVPRLEQMTDEDLLNYYDFVTTH